jgi:hypothetical protein
LPKANSWRCPACKKLHLAKVLICPETIRLIEDRKLRPGDYERAVMVSANKQTAQRSWDRANGRTQT